MGTKIIQPDAGVNCWNWDPPAETPKQIYVMFWNVKLGEKPGAVQVPNGHIFKLEQKPGSPCVWEYWNPVSNWWIQVGNQGPNSWLWLGDDNLFPNYYFEDNTGPVPFPEYQIYDNIYVTPVMTWGYGGQAVIFWMTGAAGLVDLLGFEDIPDLFLELFSVPGGDFVHKFCSLRYRINVKVRLTP